MRKSLQSCSIKSLFFILTSLSIKNISLVKRGMDMKILLLQKASHHSFEIDCEMCNVTLCFFSQFYCSSLQIFIVPFFSLNVSSFMHCSNEVIIMTYFFFAKLSDYFMSFFSSSSSFSSSSITLYYLALHK